MAAELQLAQSNPQLHNLYNAYRAMYEALGVKNIDLILKPQPSLNLWILVLKRFVFVR